MKLFLKLTLAASTVFAQGFSEKNSYEANFKQVITNNSNSQISYEGKLYIKKPSNILWQYTQPIEKKVYINGKDVIILEPELEQAIVSKLQNKLNLLEILQKAKKINESKYEATLYNTKYYLKIKDDELIGISYKDELENSVSIKMANIKSNHNIDDKRFKISIPEDFDIIEK